MLKSTIGLTLLSLACVLYTTPVLACGAPPAVVHPEVGREAGSAIYKRVAQARFHCGVAAAHAGNYKEAATWFRQAAVSGNARALYNLGWLYAQGLGVARDEVVAFALFHAAVRNGSPAVAAKADHNLDAVEKTLSARQRQQAVALGAQQANPTELAQALDKYALQKRPA